MRRILTLSVVLLGCTPKPPPVPPSVTAAISAAEQAVRDNSAIETSFAALSRELSSHAEKPMPPLMKSDLVSLSREVLVFGTLNGDPVQHSDPPVNQWETIKVKLNRVLAGNTPTEGARYHTGMPDEVRQTMENIDTALARGDVATANTLIDHLAPGLTRWMTTLPGPRAMVIHRVLEEDLTRFMMNLSMPGATPDLAKTRAFWEQTRKKIRFEE